VGVQKVEDGEGLGAREVGGGEDDWREASVTRGVDCVILWRVCGVGVFVWIDFRCSSKVGLV
jgi:hypothetical protein